LEGAATVGLTSGASVPEVLVNQVLDRLAGLGFDQVETVAAKLDALAFALPRELRLDLAQAGLPAPTLPHRA
jgi:4-hydroxy-3-methylbut-2-enyl diphosphate reductase